MYICNILTVHVLRSTGKQRRHCLYHNVILLRSLPLWDQLDRQGNIARKNSSLILTL